MNNTKEFNEGFSDRQVCEFIKLYIKDDINGKVLSAKFNVESNQIYNILHNYGFNRERTPGKSNVRGVFAPIFAKYNLTDKEIDDCIYRYMQDYRRRHVPEEVDYYLQYMLHDLGEQKELKQEKASYASQNAQKKNIDIDNIQKYGITVVVVIAIFFLVRGCGFIGDKASGVIDFVSSKYKVEAFTYDNMMYVGNKSWNKPDGVCAGIPMRSSGTTYTLGVYDGSEIEDYGIICASDIPLQSKESEKKEKSDYDEAKLRIRMGEMEESILNGYGAVFDSSESTIVLGKYKEGQLKKYGCKVSLDENGNILSVEAMKKDKVKKQLKEGTYKGMTYYPEEGRIVIDEFEFVISAGQILLKTEGVNMSVNGRQWTFDLFNEDTEEGIYVEYALGENVRCEVITNDAKGILVNESEMPIVYGAE